MAQRLVGSSGSGSDCHIAGLLAGRRRFRPSAMILDRLWWISIQFSTICTNKLRGRSVFRGVITARRKSPAHHGDHAENPR